MPDNRKLRVFLCHASQDKPIVRELYQRLLAEGWIDPWLDKEKLLPGQEWELEIEKSVEAADVVIVCLSKKSVEKEGYYQKEIKKVLDVADEKPEGTIYVIPLRLDDCIVPRRLAKWHYEDYYPKENVDKSFLRVCKSLEKRGELLNLNLKSFASKADDGLVVLGLKDAATDATEKSTVPLVEVKKTISKPHKIDHHTALTSQKNSQASGTGVNFIVAKLQWGKDNFGFSLHAEPNSYSTYGMQSTDFLHYLGFRREMCSFVTSRECFATWVEPDFELTLFARQFDEAFSLFEKAGRLLGNCGHFLDQPEGWGYFNGKSGSGRNMKSRLGYSADGHNSNEAKLLKQTEDENFLYCMSWIDGANEKGWVFHYKMKDEYSDLSLVIKFLGLKTFHECPYFEFEGCNWAYYQHENRGDSFFEGNAGNVHAWFDAQEKNFSQALEMLLKANNLVKPFGFIFLNS